MFRMYLVPKNSIIENTHVSKQIDTSENNPYKTRKTQKIHLILLFGDKNQTQALNPDFFVEWGTKISGSGTTGKKTTRGDFDRKKRASLMRPYHQIGSTSTETFSLKVSECAPRERQRPTESSIPGFEPPKWDRGIRVSASGTESPNAWNNSLVLRIK